jgi:hypothetical protein
MSIAGLPNARLDSVYVVNDNHDMPTVVQSCRIEVDHAALLSRQAKRRHLEVSTLSSLYLKGKALEEEFPGIGFRDSVGGREAYVLGHRVAVWEVVDVYHEAKTIAKTADHFSWLQPWCGVPWPMRKPIRKKSSNSGRSRSPREDAPPG